MEIPIPHTVADAQKPGDMRPVLFRCTQQRPVGGDPAQIKVGVVLPGQTDAPEHLRAFLSDADRAIADIGFGHADQQFGFFGIFRHRVHGGVGGALAALNPERDIGDPVLKRLETTDRAAECVPGVRIIEQ